LPTFLEAASGVGRVLLGVLAALGFVSVRHSVCGGCTSDLATGTLHVIDSKTSAGVRSVDLTATLREELALWRGESTFIEPDDYVLPTSTGRKYSPSNLRRDVLRQAGETANAELARSGIAPIDERLGFHGLGRTYASLRCASGDDAAYTSAQIRHTDPPFTLRCYTPRHEAPCVGSQGRTGRLTTESLNGR